MKDDVKRWNLFMPTELLNELDEFAAKRGTTKAHVVRVACTKFLAAAKAKEAQAKEQANAA